MSATARPASRLRLLAAATGYELRKKIQFRVGFLVREVLNGAVEPLVMLFVYRALYRSAGGDGARLGGWSYPEIVQYVAGLLVVRKLVFNERGLELSTEIFEGRVTKYLVMPFPYFVLAQARFVQFVGLQLVVALLVWGLGYAAVPAHWLVPVSALATLQALALALLGSYCCFLVYFTINAAAFWLDVIWSLLVMAAFVILFIGGGTIPVSQMPEGVADALRWAFPYWTISAPIELLLGRIGTPEFLRGVLVLGGWLAVLETVRRVTWRRGLARYVGAGM
ncbi:MAG: ABC-2 family transporter protein [Planctomycetota bacterium]